MSRVLENNQVFLSGEVVTGISYSHEILGEKFYLLYLKAYRESNMADVIPVIVSEKLIDINYDWKGQVLSIRGQFRSFNNWEGAKSRLILFVFAQVLEILEKNPFKEDDNRVLLDGYICKTPIYRITPLGREITDAIIVTNRPYRKSDYIPCIFWGRNAKFVSTLETGTRIKLEGRAQSREYKKKLDDRTVETRVAYEVSVSKINVVEESEETNE